MSREIFVDSGAWVAMADTGDRHHSTAMEQYTVLLLNDSRQIVTANLVVAEAHALALRRAGYLVALRFLDFLRDSRAVSVLFPGSAAHAQAEAILRRYSDQDFSLTDAVSFALMRERGISQAFAFDHHFATAGFSLLPQPPSAP